MHSHTQVQVPDILTNAFLTQPETQGMENRKLMDFFPALQCRLECDPGYVAQKTPLITCVNGEYAKGCHYLLFLIQWNLSIFAYFYLSFLRNFQMAQWTCPESLSTKKLERINKDQCFG